MGRWLLVERLDQRKVLGYLDGGGWLPGVGVDVEWGLGC